MIRKHIRIILCFIGFVIVLCILACCDSAEVLEYYSEKENYISVTGSVSYVDYNEDTNTLYLCFMDMSPALDDICFKAVGKNAEVLICQVDHIEFFADKQVTFITAPKYFGDGYVMPIVALSIEGKNLLDFENGYFNFLDWLKEK